MSGADAPRRGRRTPAPRVRPEFSFTREGRVFVLVTLGVGIGAVNTGNNLLYLVLGLMLGMLLTSGVLSEIVLRGVRVERASPPRLFAGRPGLFELRVHNDKPRLGSTSFEVGDVAEGDVTPPTAYVARLEPGEATQVVVSRTPTARGFLRGTHVRVRTRFPFGILEKSRVITAPHEWLVFPALVDVDDTGLVDVVAGHEVNRGRAGIGLDVLGLRDLREGDGLRDVHARRTAALGRPVVREREALADDPLRILLRRRLAGPDARDRFERGVSEAASLAVAAVERERPFELSDEDGLLASGRSRGELDAALTVLATITPSADPDEAARRRIAEASA